MEHTITHCFKDRTISFKTNYRIHFSEMEDIIDGIVDGVFDDNKYIPSRFDYFYWYLILAQYSDMDLNAFDADEFYEMIEDEEFINKVKAEISLPQISKIYVSAQKLIDLKLHKHPLKSIIENFDGVLNEAEHLIDALNNNPELMKHVAGLIANNQHKEE